MISEVVAIEKPPEASEEAGADDKAQNRQANRFLQKEYGVARGRAYVVGVVGKILLVLFTVVPLLETYLLFVLGQSMGFLPTVALILVTGVVGAWLAKREGLRVYRKWREAMAQMKMPEEGVLGGLLVLAGGVLLVTPGVLTDVTGFLLLIPPTRQFIAAQIRKQMEKKLSDGSVRVMSYSSVGVGGLGDIPMGVRRAGSVIDVEGEVPDVSPTREQLP